MAAIDVRMTVVASSPTIGVAVRRVTVLAANRPRHIDNEISDTLQNLSRAAAQTNLSTRGRYTSACPNNIAQCVVNTGAAPAIAKAVVQRVYGFL